MTFTYTYRLNDIKIKTILQSKGNNLIRNMLKKSKKFHVILEGHKKIVNPFSRKIEKNTLKIKGVGRF